MAKPWHKEEIKAAVRMRGTTLSKLSTDHGQHESLCRVALKRPSPTGEKIISAFLNVPLHELWPTRYESDGRRIGTRHVRDGDKRNRGDAHRLNVGAR